MSGSRWGWQAQIVSEPGMDAHRLYLWRPGGRGESDFVTGDLVIQTVNDGAVTGNVGLLLPQDSWKAIEVCVDPQPHAAEIKRLEQALSLENARVDFALGRPA